MDRNVFASGIPQPTTVKRSNSGAEMGPRASTSRMSMAPRSGGISRVSSGGNLAEMGMSTGQRSSVRKSYAPGSSQPPPASARRSSQFAVGRPSMGLGHGNSFFNSVTSSVRTDPRPLRDKQYLLRMGDELQGYLFHNGFEMDMKHQLGANAMRSPTQKEFKAMFQWLYNQIDPNYQFHSAKIENEVLLLLKNLRYPYSGSITKTQLMAVGSGNSWPTFLGILHWMMELTQAVQRFQSGDYKPDYDQEGGVDIMSERIVYRYIHQCYGAFLEANDDHQAFEDDMSRAFEKRDADHIERAQELEAENTRLKKELEELDESSQPLMELREEKSVLEDDAKKFVVYINRLDERIKKTEEINRNLQADLVTAKKDLEKVEERKASLEAQVDAQGITPQDIDRMNSEREKLNQGLSQVSTKFIEAKNKLAEQEAQSQSRLESLERAVSRYNKLAYQIGITPLSAPNANGKEYELQIVPLADRSDSGESGKLLLDNRTGYQPGQLFDVDLRHDIKPFLNTLRQDTSTKIHSEHNEVLRHQDYIDRIVEAILEKKDELETLEAKVLAVTTEYKELKEASSLMPCYHSKYRADKHHQTMQEEIDNSNAIMEKQASNLKQMRVTLSKGALEAEQKLQSVSIEYVVHTLTIFPLPRLFQC
jgi:kinetochore protein NDC80